MREFEIKPELDKKLVKLSKKDKSSYEAIMNKIQEIVDSPNVEHYKNLRYDMKGSKRVHISHLFWFLVITNQKILYRLKIMIITIIYTNRFLAIELNICE